MAQDQFSKASLDLVPLVFSLVVRLMTSDHNTASTQDEVPRLITQVRFSYRAAVGFGVVTLISYFGVMVCYHKIGQPGGPEEFGQFGDFVGGLLNPMIAGLALYWLTQSVAIQQREMSDTRRTLEQTAKVQLDHVTQASRTAEINALSALLTNSTERIHALRALHEAAKAGHKTAIEEAIRKFGNNSTNVQVLTEQVLAEPVVAEVQAHLDSLQKQCLFEVAEREKYIDQLRGLLSPKSSMSAEKSLHSLQTD